MIGKARGCRFAELRDDSRARSQQTHCRDPPQLPNRHGGAKWDARRDELRYSHICQQQANVGHPRGSMQHFCADCYLPNEQVKDDARSGSPLPLYLADCG